MKRFLRLIGAGLNWLLLALIGVEIFCFLLITLSNKLLYGQPWEGSLVTYDAYAIFLNYQGVKPTRHNPPEPDSAAAAKSLRRLWLLGGSTMRGGWVQPEETIPSYLAQLVNRPENPTKVMVTNYGENSFNSLLETKYLQKLLMEVASPPDLVIFYDGANDSAYFNQYRTPQAHHGYRRLQGLIESHRRSYLSLFKPLNAALYSSFTREAFAKLRQVMFPVYPENAAPRELVQATEKRYEHVRRLAGAYGAEFLLVWQPMLWVETDEVDPGIREQEKNLSIWGTRFLRVRENFAVTYNALADRLRDKPYFVDFRNVLCSRTTPVYEADGVHLRPQGNKLVAFHLAELLKARGWLKIKGNSGD